MQQTHICTYKTWEKLACCAQLAIQALATFYSIKHSSSKVGNNADIHRQRASLIHCIHVSPVLSNVDVKWIFFYSNYMHRQIPKAYYKSFLLCGWKWITCIYLLCLFHLLNGTKQLHISCIRRHTAATGHSPIGSFTYGLALIIQKH